MPSASGLAAAARTNPYLHRALADFPEYSRAVELRAKVIQAQRELRGVAAVPNPADAAGLDEFLAAVERRTLDELAFEAKRRALMSLRGEIDNRLPSIIAVHADAILASLAADFATLMTEVESVATELRGARNASEAIAHGAEDAWRRLPELRDEYDKLRSAQSSVMLVAVAPHILATAKSDYIDDPLASDLAIANLDEVLPGWRRPDNRATTTFGELGDRRPWPVDDPIEQLVWLVTSDAEPWLPTRADLSALRAKRQARAAKAGPKPQPVRERPGLLNTPLASRDRVAPALRSVSASQSLDAD
ncbi:hypothetical protein GBO17_14230 [Mycobacterium avium subsp. hominissuis]|uniref:hypothetical protein n=1 Tax=Mycobacterium avium TaxID=1764 RepID=UPI001CC36C59|nr:hypothetical protein [Mycobacterium avium]MBZ4558585.1 hypothetical protein [Mycobacterium avium subsp. hominissuis]MBZ4569620.1 hypothetical protein [Mycobacterium avium subsp. hominissuis]MBZ4587942.1 hypothetical protein [Mycobacterium avium subsp. hominissuis]MBZ4625449.1 hypothetical protein [Mycobacterium avium subsp. hominissuis]